MTWIAGFKIVPRSKLKRIFDRFRLDSFQVNGIQEPFLLRFEAEYPVMETRGRAEVPAFCTMRLRSPHDIVVPHKWIAPHKIGITAQDGVHRTRSDSPHKIGCTAQNWNVLYGRKYYSAVVLMRLEWLVSSRPYHELPPCLFRFSCGH